MEKIIPPEKENFPITLRSTLIIHTQHVQGTITKQQTQVNQKKKKRESDQCQYISSHVLKC